LGLQSSPPNTVIVSLALFLTAFIMGPTFEAAYRDGLQPLMQGSITEEQGVDRTVKPFQRSGAVRRPLRLETTGVARGRYRNHQTRTRRQPDHDRRTRPAAAARAVLVVPGQ
jgi:type III secretory pathway component EscR